MVEGADAAFYPEDAGPLEPPYPEGWEKEPKFATAFLLDPNQEIEQWLTTYENEESQFRAEHRRVEAEGAILDYGVLFYKDQGHDETS